MSDQICEAACVVDEVGRGEAWPSSPAAALLLVSSSHTDAGGTQLQNACTCGVDCGMTDRDRASCASEVSVCGVCSHSLPPFAFARRFAPKPTHVALAADRQTRPTDHHAEAEGNSDGGGKRRFTNFEFGAFPGFEWDSCGGGGRLMGCLRPTRKPRMPTPWKTTRRGGWAWATWATWTIG